MSFLQEYLRLFLSLQLLMLCGMGTMGAVVSQGKATPRNMEQIFIGRCEEYQNVIRPDAFNGSRKNCTDLWAKFKKAFAYKDPCSVTVESYTEFVDGAYHDMVTENRVMYWSGPVYPMVIDYTRLKSNQYVTIREILAAFVIRNIDDWCGQVAAPGINYESCPAWGKCPLLATTSFWTALSKNFAKQVKGTVHLMLNGSTGEAYRNTSIFAHSELKNLDASRTPTLHLHLAYTPQGPIKEKCGIGTVVQLQQDVEKKGMKFKCSDDDIDLQFFICVTNMDAESCKSGGNAFSSRNGAVHLYAPGPAQLLASGPLRPLAEILWATTEPAYLLVFVFLHCVFGDFTPVKPPSGNPPPFSGLGTSAGCSAELFIYITQM